jgi:monoamine oxidase
LITHQTKEALAMSEDTDFDLVIVGAGVAGATVAAEAAKQGHRIAVVEARDRLGGRGFSTAFGHGLADVVEYGGGWIAPWQHTTQTLARDLGLTLVPRAPRGARVCHDGSVRHDDGKAWLSSPAIRPEIARVEADVTAAKAGARFADLSFDAWMDGHAFSPEMRTQLLAWWRMSGSADTARANAEEVLRFAGYHDCTLEGIVETLGYTVAGGAAQIATRQIERSGATVIHAPAVAVETGPDQAVVRLGDGRQLTCKALVLATGVNALRTIDLPRGLLSPEQARAAARGHIGAACKLLLSVEGVEPGALATGGPVGVQLLWADKRLSDGTTLVIGFGPVEAARGATDDDVAAILARFFPAARLSAWTWHDWVADPWSAGTWATPAMGDEDFFEWPVWASRGRIFFASSDFGPKDAGWFEGAVHCGRATAGQLNATLG